MVPLAGTRNGLAALKTASGLAGKFQPWGQTRGGGAWRGSPSGAPESAQRASVSRSDALNERSLENLPQHGSANHGGIFFAKTWVRIDLAQGRTWPKVRNGIGAASPGRWHSWQ